MICARAERSACGNYRTSGYTDAQLYDPTETSVRGIHAFFLILGEPEAYGLPAEAAGSDNLPEVGVDGGIRDRGRLNHRDPAGVRIFLMTNDWEARTFWSAPSGTFRRLRRNSRN